MYVFCRIFIHNYKLLLDVEICAFTLEEDTLYQMMLIWDQFGQATVDFILLIHTYLFLKTIFVGTNCCCSN